MAKVQIASVEKDAVADIGSASPGGTDSRAVFESERDPLHMTVHRLGPDAILAITGEATDYVAYVWRGAALVDGMRMEERSSLIVEKGAAIEMIGAEDGTAILVFSLNGRPEQPRAGGHVLLLPSDRVPRTLDMGGAGVAGGALHADAGLPSSEVWLHENDFYKADYEVAVHSHTEDEIIFVRAGSVKLGNRLFGPGTALAIAANTKYGFRAGPDGLSFVNFRAKSPCHVNADGSHVMDEAELWRRVVGSPDYLELAAG
jgi:hypothetical protein